MTTSSLQLLLSNKEYEVVSEVIQSNIDDSYQLKKRTRRRKSVVVEHDANAAAFRAATRVYLGTSLSIKGIEAVINRLRARKGKKAPAVELGISRHRLALSLAALLFFHRVLYRALTRLRLQLLHEKVRDIANRYPILYAALTSRLAPAIGASLSGLAMGIYPASQLRITVTIYAFVRALELLYKSADAAGLMKRKPWWAGSWMIFALSQGQLLHAFVFDRDCSPEVYGNFILNNTHEYLQRKPENMSDRVVWPVNGQIVTALAEMARLNWPPFVSPILHPTSTKTLPPTINSVITPITSRAHPATQHLSCALLHPSETSCFTPYLRQVLLSFPHLARFFALYYGALSLLSIKRFYHAPGPFVNHLSQQILKTTMVVSGTIATAWGSICLFNNIFPRMFLPEFRFFLGGLLGGSFAIIDNAEAGHANAMYTARNSINSLWKVGKKRGWWKGVSGGDVWVFTASLMALNVVYDWHRAGRVGKDNSMGITKVLRGEIEIGLQDSQAGSDQRSKGRE